MARINRTTFRLCLLGGKRRSGTRQCTESTFREAKNRGITQIPEIVRIEAQKIGLPEHLCKDYLQHHIYYDLAEPEIAGLEHFYKLAVKNGLVDSQQGLHFET